MDRLTHGLNAVLSLLLVGGSLWVLPTLPARVPRHFGLGGTADAYWDATLLHWMALPAIAIVVVGGLYGAAWWVGTRPAAVSMPDQQRYDALRPADQRLIAGHVQTFLYGTATATLVLFVVAQGSTYHVATSATNTLPRVGWVLTLGIPVVLTIATGALAWWLPRRVRRLAGDRGP